MKILFAGDSHGSRSVINAALDLAKDLSCDKIFQVGDFGFWPQSERGNVFLTYCDERMRQVGIPFYFLAGNHEDWNNLDYVYTTYRTDEDGFYQYGAMNIAPRVHAWEWGGMHFANMSGAFSIDRKFRTKNLDWFEQEMPTYQDAEHLMELLSEKQIGSVDVMLAHDAPVNMYQLLGFPEQVFVHALAFQAQEIADYAVREIAPSVYIHGHWHMGHRYWHGGTYCIGLNQMTVTGGPPDNSFTVLDTEKRTMSSLYGTHESVIFEIP